MSNPVYILDVFSLVFQVFHGLPPMTGPAGQPTNAVFGFTRDVMNLLREHQPSHLYCAMDSPGKGIRNDWYPEYKANRDAMPEDLVPQIAMIEEVIAGFGLPVLRLDGWEADDIFATLAKRAAEAGHEVRIVTSDKDARQLINSRVQLYHIRKDEFQDEEFVKEQWGVRPDQVIDFQSLVGDSVDNVPGMPLVGPKKARILLEQYGTLEEVLAHADEVNGKKLKENLVTFADQSRLSRRLVTLYDDLPLELDWDAQRIGSPDVERLNSLFNEFGFRSFPAELRKLTDADGDLPTGETDTSETTGDDGGPAQGQLFGQTDRRWTLVDTTEQFDTFLEELSAQNKICFDLETTGLDELTADIVGWAFCWEPGHGWYVPVRGPEGARVLDPDTVRDALRPVIESEEIEKTNQNIKYDMLVLRRAGLELAGIGVDPMIGHFLVDAGARSHSLAALSEKYLNHTMIPISDLIGKGKNQKSMADIDVDQVAEYASEDADVSWQVAELITDELERNNLWDLYWELERPLIPILAEMEYAGIRLDSAELGRQAESVGERLVGLVEEIHELAGREFNIDSPKQLREILFEELKLPVQKRTKTGPSTDQSVLEKLAPLHPLPERITEHRQLSKLKNTYLDALPALVNDRTGRLHTSFNQVAASTGRLSSLQPNLQNIPVRTTEGRQVRRAFVPGDTGMVLLCADYSQVELRVLAHFSGDSAMQTAFHDGVDIHAAVAAEVFGVDAEEVDSDMRRMAKAVNFGVVYGQSPFGLAASLGISQLEAAKFIDGYFSRYHGVADYLDRVLDECRRSGFAETIRGRRRPIHGIRPEPNRQRNMPERTAINSVIQGSAADLIKQAMIGVDRALKQDGHPGTMLLQIHDELVFEVPENDLESLVALVRQEMESALALDVPLVVDCAAGHNWLEIQEIASD
ncbi:MAG: DNA polymerase I [Planctomycetota bacterium]|nr:DNA polymerase I [Planctomycetota bacterium]MED5401818.1 DNA polymerase I [Planctomycetota bacterium]